MKLRIRISETMIKECDWNDFFEDRIIRIPEEARKKYSIEQSSFLNLRTRSDEIIALQVVPAFKEDVAKDPLAGYVSRRVYERLRLEQEFSPDVERVGNITLGCDPEAFLVDRFSGNIVSATRFFRKMGEVGHDGMLLEFRPKPSIYEEEVTNNLWALINQTRNHLNKFQEGSRIGILGASGWQGLTAGFHLHYGLPRGLLGGKGIVHVVASQMVKAFDYYIGIPSIIPEGEIDHKRRTVSYVDYGKPGGFRLDGRTFEYRLPGGSLLRHPVLTRGLMSLGAIVVEDLVSRMKVCTDNFMCFNGVTTLDGIKDLYPHLPNETEIFHSIVTIDLNPARKHLQTIISDVRNMVGYKNRQRSVEEFFNCVLSGTPFDYDIERNWGGYYHAKSEGQMGVL